MRAKEFIRRPAVEAFADLVNKEKEIASKKIAPVKAAGPPGFDYNAAARMAGVKPVVPNDQQVGQDKTPVPGRSVTTVPGTSLTTTPPDADIGTQNTASGQRLLPNNGGTPAADIGTQSSTGGQTFNTPTGTVHKANANNPNFNARPANTTSANASAAKPASSATPAAVASAPSLGPPAAVQAQQAKQAQAPSGDKSTGFFGGMWQGFKQGMGGREIIDPVTGKKTIEPLSQLATRKAAGGLGLQATASQLGKQSLPKIGTSLNDPKLGKLTVQQPNAKHPDMLSVKTADGRTIFMDPDSL